MIHKVVYLECLGWTPLTEQEQKVEDKLMYEKQTERKLETENLETMIKKNSD